MEIKQETKSLPRNRKCGNCRYFEPAPLWRKGWCRNPRLYDRRANHLVDAATIDCEQVFRARIYWEPVPVPETVQPAARFGGLVNSMTNNNPAADSGQADGGGRGRVGNDGILRPARVGGMVTQSPINPAIDRGQGNLPTIKRVGSFDQTQQMPTVQSQGREKSTASPGLVAKPSQARRWLMENIPYYDKIDGPISRMTPAKALPWGIIAVLLIIVMLNVMGSKKETVASTQNNTNPTAVSGSNALANGSVTLSASQEIAQPTSTPSSSKSQNVPPATATLSNIVPTETPVPTVAPTARPTETNVRVKGVGPGGLNMRKDPGTKAVIVKSIPEGKTVKIRSGDFKNTAEGEWWPISYDGQDGWALSIYLERITKP